MQAWCRTARLARPLWTQWHAVLLSALPHSSGRHAVAFSSAAAAISAEHSTTDRPHIDHEIGRQLKSVLLECHSVDGLLSLVVSHHSHLNLLHYSASLRQLTDLVAPNSSSALKARSARHVAQHPGWQLLMSGLSERVSGLESNELVSVMDYVRRLYAVLPTAEVVVERVEEDYKEINVFGWYWRFATSEERGGHTSAHDTSKSVTHTERSVDGVSGTRFHQLLAALLEGIEHKFHQLSADECALLLNSLSSLARLHQLQPRLLPTAHELTFAIERRLSSHPYSLRYLSLISTSLYRLHRVCYPNERADYPLLGRKDVVRCPPHQVRFQLVMGLALTLTDEEQQQALLDTTQRSVLHLSHVLEAVCVIAEDGAWIGLLESVARSLIGRVSELSGHEISRLLLCFSRMQLNHDTLYHCLAERLLQCAEQCEVSMEPLVHSMFALVWLKRKWSPAVESLLAFIVRLLSTPSGMGKVRRLTQQHHAMIAWSLAVARLPTSIDTEPLLRRCLSFLPLHNCRPSAMSLVLLYELSLGLPEQLHALIPAKLLQAARQRYKAYRAAQPPPIDARLEGVTDRDEQAPRGRFAYYLPKPDQLERSSDALVWWVDDARHLQRYGARGDTISEVQWMREQLDRRHVAVVEVGWRERRELKQINGEQRINWLKKKVEQAKAKGHSAEGAKC